VFEAFPLMLSKYVKLLNSKKKKNFIGIDECVMLSVMSQAFLPAIFHQSITKIKGARC
jgi:hypothetical protein